MRLIAINFFNRLIAIKNFNRTAALVLTSNNSLCIHSTGALFANSSDTKKQPTPRWPPAQIYILHNNAFNTVFWMQVFRTDHDSLQKADNIFCSDAAI